MPAGTGGMQIKGAKGTVQVKLKTEHLDLSVVTGPGGIVEKSLRRAAGITRDRVKRNITAKGRIDTGRMRQSVDYKTPRLDGKKQWTAEVGIYTKYAVFQEKGTPKQTPGTGFIYPKHAKALKFKSGGVVIFRKRVRGVKPMNALRDAIKELSPKDFTL